MYDGNIESCCSLANAYTITSAFLLDAIRLAFPVFIKIFASFHPESLHKVVYVLQHVRA